MSTARLTDDELALVVGRVRATLARLGDAADDPIVVDNVIDDEIALAIDYRRGPPGRENGPGQGAVSDHHHHEDKNAPAHATPAWSASC